MDKQRKNKMTKDTIPEGFSVPLAVFDLIPVIFFGLSAIREQAVFSQHIVCNRSSDMPCFRRSQSTLEADCRCCKEKHMADVRTNANFYANRIYCSDNNAHC